MASDDFNRSDAGDLGANWTNQGGAGQGFKIVSNRAAEISGANWSGAFRSAESFNANQYAEAVYKEGVFGGVAARQSVATSSWNGYLVLAAGRIYSMVGGTPTLLQNYAVAASVDDVIRIEVSGSTIKAFYDGVQQGTDQSDSSLASGSPGLASFATATMDDWVGNDLGGAPATTYPGADGCGVF